MPGKGKDSGGKLVTTVAGAAAAFVARKALVLAWRKATGREPPEKAEDRQVAIGEAVAWAMLVGAGVGVARVLAARLATRPSRRQLDPSEE